MKVMQENLETHKIDNTEDRIEKTPIKFTTMQQ